MVHQIVKAEKLSLMAVGMLEQELLVPKLFTRVGIDAFKGAADDTVSVTVEGVLPHHDYAFRNDRSSPIVFDDYAERKIAVTFGGNVYSAVKVTDEQFDFDLQDWGKLLRPQCKAVARGLGRRAIAALTGQTYNVTIGNAQGDLRGALVEARRVLNKFNVPMDGRYLLVGSGFESALLGDDKLRLALNVGDANAEDVLASATLGTLYGFRVVVDQTIGADDAYACAGSGFIFLSGAPSVPASVGFGATTSFEDIALRWVRDYDPTYMQDRSVVNTYAGFRAVEDVIVGWNPALNGGLGSEVVSTDEYFVRGVKITLDGSSNYPAAASELAVITGITDASVWTPSGRRTEVHADNA